MNLGKQLQKANDELLARGNLAAVREMFAPDYVVHFGGADLRGPQAIAQFLTELRGAFPDLRYELEILAEAGDRIAWMRTHRGKHRSDFMGVRRQAARSLGATWWSPAMRAGGSQRNGLCRTLANACALSSCEVLSKARRWVGNAE